MEKEVKNKPNVEDIAINLNLNELIMIIQALSKFPYGEVASLANKLVEIANNIPEPINK